MVYKFLLALIMIVAFMSALIIAQPGFPVTPNQAPIDGGLGLLAAAGGAYAIKKLRDKKSEIE